MPATTAAFSSSSTKPGQAARARSANSRTDSQPATAATVTLCWSGTCRGGTSNSCSPLTCSGARLVTTILSSAVARRIARDHRR